MVNNKTIKPLNHISFNVQLRSYLIAYNIPFLLVIVTPQQLRLVSRKVHGSLKQYQYEIL